MGCCGSTPYIGAEKKVVVVGGGMAGVKLCHHLAQSMHNLHITILSPNDAMDISWASPRAIADPASASRNVVQFTHIFKNGRVVHKQGTAASVSAGAVTTSTGEVSCEKTPYPYSLRINSPRFRVCACASSSSVPRVVLWRDCFFFFFSQHLPCPSFLFFFFPII